MFESSQNRLRSLTFLKVSYDSGNFSKRWLMSICLYAAQKSRECFPMNFFESNNWLNASSGEEEKFFTSASTLIFSELILFLPILFDVWINRVSYVKKKK